MDRIPAYEGKGNFMFVSYSHKDSGTVYPFITDLFEKKYPIGSLSTFWLSFSLRLPVIWEDTLDMSERCRISNTTLIKNSNISTPVETQIPLKSRGCPVPAPAAS